MSLLRFYCVQLPSHEPEFGGTVDERKRGFARVYPALLSLLARGLPMSRQQKGSRDRCKVGTFRVGRIKQFSLSRIWREA